MGLRGEIISGGGGGGVVMSEVVTVEMEMDVDRNWVVDEVRKKANKV